MAHIDLSESQLEEILKGASNSQVRRMLHDIMLNYLIPLESASEIGYDPDIRGFYWGNTGEKVGDID